MIFGIVDAALSFLLELLFFLVLPYRQRRFGATSSPFNTVNRLFEVNLAFWEIGSQQERHNKNITTSTTLTN